MKEIDNAAVQDFIDGWVAELGKAVEMFSGEEPTVTVSCVDRPHVEQSGNSLWVRQVFVGLDSFESWIGAEEATWMKLGQMLGTASEETIRSTYIEIINQAQQGSATLASVDRPKPIRCEELTVEAALTADLSRMLCWEVVLEGMKIPALTLMLEGSVVRVVASESSATGDNGLTQHTNESFGNLDTFRNLLLPVSVSLVEAELELKQLLNAGLKSVISLNKHHHEPVDLLVYDTVVARGELVLIDGNYGFRVQEIVSEEQRLTLLQ